MLVFAGRLTDAEGPRRRTRGGAEVDGPRLRDRRRPGARAARGGGAGSAAARAFSGRCRAQQVLGLVRAADAVVLTSAWENFPHGVVEALAVGTPVIATASAALPRSFETARTGCSSSRATPPRSPRRCAGTSAISGLHARLRAAATPSVGRLQPDAVYGRLESILEGAAMKPTVFFAGRTRYRAAALADPRTQVGCARRRARRARHRLIGRRLARRRDISAAPANGARRAALLAVAAGRAPA